MEWDAAADALYASDGVAGDAAEPIDVRVEPPRDAAADAPADALPAEYRACGACLCLDGVHSSSGVPRMFCGNKTSWWQASAACRAAGMDLVQPRSIAASEQLRAQADAAGVSGSLWLAGTEHEHEGTWRWLDGTVFPSSATAAAPFEYWDREEPNDKYHQEDCLELRDVPTGKWNDRSCLQLNVYACEGVKAPLAPVLSDLQVNSTSVEVSWQPGDATEVIGWMVVIGHLEPQLLDLPAQTRSLRLPIANFGTMSVRAKHGVGEGSSLPLLIGFAPSDVVASIRAPASSTPLMHVAGGMADTEAGVPVHKGNDLQVELEPALGWALLRPEARRFRRPVLELDLYDDGTAPITVIGTFFGSLATIQRTNQNGIKTSTIDLSPFRDPEGGYPTRFELFSLAAGNSNPIRLHAARLRLVP